MIGNLYFQGNNAPVRFSVHELIAGIIIEANIQHWRKLLCHIAVGWLQWRKYFNNTEM
jgi:hypothetical protein